MHEFAAGGDANCCVIVEISALTAVIALATNDANVLHLVHTA